MKIRRLLCFTFVVLSFFCFGRSASAKDEWIQVRSRNFYLLGNATEKDIRKVATRLEQFREVFQQLFKNVNLSSPIPINVVVFKSDSAYRQFKPKNALGKTEERVAGYFQPGEDINYITLSTEGEDAETFKVIFHEFTHSMVNTNFGKSEIPAWFNEGLAEYYSTFAIEEDQKVKLGLNLPDHVLMLRQSALIPLEQLFTISNYQLHQMGDHGSSIFYAESWALIHYFSQTGKADNLNRFLTLLVNGIEPAKAFSDAFHVSYAQMEGDLKKYVGNSTYQYNLLTFQQKLTFDNEMTASPLGEGDANAYLGDLLYHTNRPDDAEPFLANALKLQPDSSMGNMTMGMVKLRQRKFDEARGYLEKALKSDSPSAMAYYRYAYLLSREGTDEFGYSTGLKPDTIAKMRDALNKAIKIDPTFSESYELLAYTDLTNNDQLEEGLVAIRAARKYQPGNQNYAMREAELLLQLKKYDEAEKIAAKIAATADEADLRQRAGQISSALQRIKEYNDRVAAQNAAIKERIQGGGPSNPGGTPPRLQKPTSLSPEERSRLLGAIEMRDRNRALRPTAATEQRVMGKIIRVDCKPKPIYTIKTANETFALTSKDFQEIEFSSYVEAANSVQIGCGANIGTINAIITYRPETSPGSRGTLRAIEFIADDFRLMTAEEMKQLPEYLEDYGPVTRTPPARSNSDTGGILSSVPPPGLIVEKPVERDPIDEAAQRRDAILEQMRSSLPGPAAGEKREFGFMDKSECNDKGQVFVFHTATTQGIRLAVDQKAPPNIVFYAHDLEGQEFGCTTKAIEFPVVFIYKDTPDKKLKAIGTLTFAGFMPRSFTLQP